jgi:hypothetical protein
MSEPLTDAEIVELRRVVVEHVVGRMLDERTAPYVQQLVNALPRLTDEVVRARQIRKTLGLARWPDAWEAPTDQELMALMRFVARFLLPRPASGT